MKYPIILADPPVPFAGWAAEGAAIDEYPLMTWDDLKSLKPYIDAVTTPDCILFLWLCQPLLIETLDMVNAWGFTYKTKAFSWCKTYKKNNGFFMGMGYWTRANTEDVLLLTKGKPHRDRKDIAQLFVTLEADPYQVPAVVAPLVRHSQKPEEVQDRIERLVSGPYLELFARRHRPGWTCIGNELDGLDIRESLARLAANEALPVVRRAVEQESFV